MIQPPAAFTTANAALNKQPIYAILITGYTRAFVTAPGLGNFYPSLGVCGLVGCFTDPTGQIIGQPFVIGNGPISFKVPYPATQLQLGINDDRLNDNSGSFNVSIQVNGGPGTTVNVPGTTDCWIDTGGLNSAFNYGPPDGTAPVVFPGLTAGQVVTITYLNGLVHFFPFDPGSDANGNPNLLTGFNPGPGNGNFYPTHFMPIPALDWLVDIQDLQITIDDLNGGSNLGDLVFRVQDRGQAITADMSGGLAAFTFEGKRCQLLHGFQGMALSNYLVMFTGVINTVASANANNEYQFTVSSANLKKLTAKVYLTGNDGIHPPSSNNPKTLNAHPLNILVSVLQQAGVPGTSIDTNKIYYYRDTIYSGLTYVFTLTASPTAKDFIENEIMKPLGMYLWENSGSLLSINSFYPALSGGTGSGWSYTPPTLPVATLDITNTTDVPLADEAQLIDQVIFNFDDDGTGSSKFLSENIATYTPSVNLYGLTDGQTIQSQGMKSGFQGFFMAAIVSRLIFLRYGLKNLVMTDVPAFWSMCVLEPGDIIALTEPYVPDRVKGVLGITAKTFEVMDRKWSFMSGMVYLKLLAVDLSKFKQFQITPNGEPTFASDSAANQQKYLYECNNSDQYSTGAAANTLG